MWSFAKHVLIILTGVFFMGSTVQAQETEDIAMLEILLSGQPVAPTLFTEQFLEAVPYEQLSTVIAELTDNIGMPTEIIPVEEEYEVITPTHTMSAFIALDETGKVAGLLFRPPVPLNAQLPDLLAALADTAENTSYIVLQGDIVLGERRAEVPMAIGSAFKLAILRVLQDDIESKSRSWEDITILTPNLRSLPSGFLQDFPDNAPLTLHTLASLMISQSDNTATDMLLALVGRNRVSAYLEGQFVLSTRELFQLKDDKELAEEFASGDHETKQNISDILSARALPATNVGTVPYRNGIEWYMSAKQLCTLIESVRELDVFKINPGPARARNWDSIAYKGGSEVGVLNLTSWLKADDGRQYCVVFSANSDSALPETEAINAYAALLGYLARQN